MAHESDAPDSKDIAPSSDPLTYDSGDLFQGAKEILIKHNGEQYRLRITKSDKLILTK